MTGNYWQILQINPRLSQTYPRTNCDMSAILAQKHFFAMVSLSPLGQEILGVLDRVSSQVLGCRNPAQYIRQRMFLCTIYALEPVTIITQWLEKSKPWHNTLLHAQLPPSFLDMDACTTSQLNVVLVCKLLCAWLIFDTLSISVCTTSHRQTAGQLVQELNVCTIDPRRFESMLGKCWGCCVYICIYGNQLIAHASLNTTYINFPIFRGAKYLPYAARCGGSLGLY